MTQKLGTAAIIGGSIAGLMTARVLSEHFDRVMIFERDVLPAQPQHRAGVPQGMHIHAVLTKGRDLIEGFFPGFVDEVVQGGAPLIDHINDRRRLASYGWQPRFESELRMLLIGRPTLEYHIRKRVVALPNVTLEAGVRADELISENGVITGIVLAEGEAETERRVTADLIVDASGRSSNAPEWMEDLGFGAVTEMQVDAKWGYASRFYETPKDWPYDWKLINMWPQIRRTDAQRSRGGVLCPLDGGQCIVTLVGNAGDFPPRDEGGFLKFAESLFSPEIADFIKAAKPVSPITISRTTVNKWRRYDQLEKKPENFIVIGDAVAAFNPVYGQGMSCAAMEAKELGDGLSEWLKTNGADLSGFAPMAQARIATTGNFPWALSTGGDAVIEGVEGISPPAIEARAYSERATALGAIDPRFVVNFENMANLVSDHKWMFEPEVRKLVIANWDRLGQLSGAPAAPAPAQ